jgi:WD40 repeat protein/uncharacterized caspase-like protein
MYARGALLFTLMVVLALGCAGNARPPDHGPADRPVASAPLAPTAEAAAPSCPDAAPPIPRGADKASFVLQDGHTTMVVNVELSANGRLLVSTGLDGTVRVWDTKTGIQLRRLATLGAAVATSLSSAGDRLAFLRLDVASQSNVAVVKLATGEAPHQLPESGAFRLSPDGKRLAVGWDELSIVDPETGALQVKLHPFQPPASPPAGARLDPAYRYNAVTALAFDETGARLAVTSGLEVAILDTATWKVIARRPHGLGLPAGVPGGPPKGAGPPVSAMPGADPRIIQPGWFPTSLVFKGDALVLLGTLGARIVSARDGGSPRSLPVQPQSAAVLGDTLLTTDVFQRVEAFSLATGAKVSAPGLALLKGSRIAVSADGSTIALATASSSAALARAGMMDLRIHDARSMRLLRTLESHLAVVEGVAVRADGGELTVASRGGAVTRWDLRRGDLLGLGRGSLGLGHSTARYDDAGELLLVSSGTRFVTLHDARSGRVLRQWEPTGQLIATAWFLPAKKQLAALDATGTLTTWDVAPAASPQPPVDIGTATVARPARIGAVTLPGPIAAAAVSADRSRVAAITADRMLTTPDPSGRLKYKDVYTEAEVVLADVGNGVTRWTTKVISGYDAKWIAFAPDDEGVLVSSMEDTRGLLSPSGQMIRPVGDLLRVLDGKTGAITRTERVRSSGPMAVSGKAVAIGGRFPVVLTWPTLASHPVDAPDYMIHAIAAVPGRDAFLFGGDSGGTSLASSLGEVSMLFASTTAGEYVTATLDGVFRASLDGARSVAWTFGAPLEGYAFAQFGARFDRPDLVAARLAGSASPPPAAVIRPPLVTLDRSAAGAPLLTRSARVRAHVSSPRRVDRVRVFVNGRPLAEQLVCAPEGEVDVEVPVAAGHNRLTVMAYDADGFASNPETLDLLQASPSSARPDLWSISVGVSKYRLLSPQQQLDFADDDARSISAALAAEVGEGRPFGALHATTLIDDEVSVESVDRALAGLAAMGPDDLAVVFLAGHGVSLDEGQMVYLTGGASLSKESAREHGIGWDRIRAALGRARGRVVVLLDACHSGHVSTELIAPNEALAQELSAAGRSGVLVFAAARGSQLSYEVPVGRATLGSSRGLELAWEGKPAAMKNAPVGGHGLFTSALLEALSGQAPDADHSSAVEASELIDYVTERVREASNGQQTPWVARREMFGDFVVAPAR